MEKLKSLMAGLAGAIALNLLHEGLKTAGSVTPRIDLLGEEALNKGLNWLGKPISNQKDLYKATLAGDIVGNAFYYSLIATGGARLIWAKAVLSGLAAGFGAVSLPKTIGLDERPVAWNNQTKVLTISYYLTGALVTGWILSKTLKK